MKNLTLALIVISCLHQIAYAQLETIEIDTITNVPNKPLPFDKPFVLKMFVSEDVVSVIFLKQYGRRDLSATIIDRIKNDSLRQVNEYINVHGVPPPPPGVQGSFSDFQILQSSSIVNRKIGDKKVALISFADKNLLKPNTNYFFIISKKNLDSNVSSFFKNFYLFKKNNTAPELQKALKSFAVFKVKHREEFGDLSFLLPSDNHFTGPSGPANIQDFGKAIEDKQKYEESLSELFDKYFANITNGNTLIQGRDMSTNWTQLRGLLASLRNDITLTDTKENNKTFDFLSRDSYKAINSIVDLNLFDFKELRLGKVALSCLNCEKLNDNIELKTAKRIANISQTITLLNDIRRNIGILQPTDPRIKENALIELKKVIDDLLEISAALTLLSKSDNDITEAILTRKYLTFRFYSYTVLSGGSHILSLETRSKNLITPDFGMAFPNIFKRNTGYGLLPYVGFHVNFAPIDRDAIFSKYKKSFAQRMSLSIGYSLVSIKDSTAKEQKFNFFEKSSLLTGLGFRLGNLVRIIGGYQWYFQVPASTVAVEKKLKGYPFLGISIDLSVKSLLNGLVDVFPGIGKTRETIQPSNIVQP